MRARLAVGLAIAVLSCGRGTQEGAAGARKDTVGAAQDGTHPLWVKLNGYRIDVKGSEPAVPAELEPASDRRVPARTEELSPDPGTERFDPGAPRLKRRGTGDAAAAAKRKKWIVQLSGPIHDAERSALAALGAEVGDYLPDFAFVVSMDRETRARVEGLPFVRGAVRYKPAYKISRRLKDESGAVRVEAGTTAKLLVHADSPEGLVTFLSAVHDGKGKVQRVSKDVAQVEVLQAGIARLAQLEEVLWIEQASPLRLFNDTSRWTIQTNVPGSTLVSDQGLDGTGQIVGVGDSGLDHDMCWFRDPLGTPIGPMHRKVVGYAIAADDYDGDAGHGTHVSGTVAGDQEPVTGATTANGMAPKARLFMTDLFAGESNSFTPPADLGDVFLTPYGAGARIHTNSWGGPFNEYDGYARSIDRFVWQHKDFLVLFANGNSGPGEYTVSSPATAKDLVSVGATENGAAAENVASFSSNGPAIDGRIKPTVTAPGVAIWSADSDGLKGSNNCGTRAYSGTSMATPTTAGAAALVRQYYVDGFYPSGMARPADAFTPSAALVKATLVSSAQNAAGDYTDAPIPSSGQGWGRINLSNTLRFAAETKYLSAFDVAEGLGTGGSWSEQLYSAGGTPLKVTLVWSDYPGALGADTALVNDLDLEVVAPDGTTTYLGNAFAEGHSVAGGGADRLNVEEQVYLPESSRGYYTLRVRGYNVPFGPQPFALVVTGAGTVTSHGFLALDRTRYNAATTVEIKVTDRDLNADSGLAEEVFVTIRSSAESADEVVRLVETGPDTSVFLGTIPTGPAPGVPGDGILAVAEGATIVATYEDADDGTGLPVTASDAAVGDLTPPLISSISVSALGQGDATISWSTNEPANPTVLYGPSRALGATQASPSLRTSHAVKLGGLAEATTYYYAVQAVDEAGNVAREDAAGALYTFTTRTLPPEVEVYSSRGAITPASDTVIFGTARDPSGVVSLTVNGQAVTVRAIDGYFEIDEPLALGDNLFAVVATDGLGQVQTASVTVDRIPLPDLVVASVSAPERVGVEAPFSSTIQVCNAGNGAAEPESSWRIAWAILDDAGQGWVIRNERVWDWIGAGTCYSYTRSINISTYYGGRTYHLAAVADFYDDIWEANEGNNDNVATNPTAAEWSDLTVTALGAPPSVATMAPFDVTSTVANLGLGGAYWTEVGIYLSSDDAITTADRRIALQSRPELFPGGQSFSLTTPVTLPSDVPSGTYRLGAIVDPNGGVAEANEANNTLLGPSITVAGPDLEVVTVSGPASVSTGGSMTVHDQVRARPGGGGASGFTIAFYLSPDAVITTADLKLGERTVAGLAGGATSAADTVVTIPATWAGGTYYLGAIADVRGEVVESDEANNAGAGNTVTVVGPDLVATSVLAPSSAFTGETIVVQDTVTANAAGGAVPEFDVGIFFSLDPVITPSDMLIGWRHVSALQPGGSSSGATAVTLPAGVAAGTYWVGIIADDFSQCWEDQWENVTCIGGDVAKETNGANNVASTSLAVGGTDLVSTDVSAPAAGNVGQPLVVHDSVAALGGGAAWFTVSFYLSTDPLLTTSDVLLGSRNVLGLPPGGSSTADTSFVVPAWVAPGTYYVGAFVDPANAVVESNEGNNTRVGNPVTIGGADLVVTSVSGPPAVATMQPFQVTTSVSNVGGGSSVSTGVSIYLSSDATITQSDTRLAAVGVGPLAPGASSTTTTTVTVPSTLPGGTYYLGAIVDPTYLVREANEANNALAGSTVAVTGPDLFVTSASAPASAATGGTIVVESTVASAASGGGASAVDVGIFLSSDPVITLSDLSIGGRAVGDLAAGAASTGGAVATVPTTLAGGTYYVGVIVDPLRRVAESDEENNALVAGVIQITGPDLVATAVAGPATATRGAGMTVTDTVTASAAGGAAPEFYVGFFLSADPVITQNDRQIGSRYVSGLASGASTSASTFVTLPGDLAPGTYYLGVIVDDFWIYVGDEWDGYYVYDNVKESDATNNVLSGGAIVITAPAP